MFSTTARIVVFGMTKGFGVALWKVAAAGVVALGASAFAGYKAAKRSYKKRGS